MNGIPLDPRIIPIAACNPYRKREDKEERVGLAGPAKRSEDLDYKVNPMPESMREYVWNFGKLDDEEEKIYIEAILSGLEGIQNVQSEFVDILVQAHSFIRKNLAHSPVSLRDVARTLRVYRFFMDFYKREH